MRAHDFDNRQTAVNYFSRRSNVIGRIDLGDYTVFLDEHLMYRQKGRDVDEFVIQEVLPKIPQAKAKIKTLVTGQSFYIYDNTNKIALGIKIDLNNQPDCHAIATFCGTLIDIELILVSLYT